ncbi:portal protein [Agarilytica rhodophyticola]|uniref:portal protein n=1 Tax=Agarilytica rhodophyticola TaxID=1737490 RepID=UPI000B345481|nr:hypothetical protein [Agarilytica rhodophyticola]
MIEQRLTPASEIIANESARHAAIKQIREISVRNHEDSLAGFIRSQWTVAREHRRTFTYRFEDCLRRRSGIYSSEMKAKLESARSSEIFMRITSSKCKAAKTWLADLFEPAGDKPFTFQPANYPEINPELEQALMKEAEKALQQSQMPEAKAFAMVDEVKNKVLDDLKQKSKQLAEKMEDRVEDILTEANWRNEFDDFLDDVVTYPVAIMAGLEYRNEKELSWGENEFGQWVPSYKDRVKPKVRRVSPFRFYPSPSVTTSLRGHYCIEHITYTRQDLVSMKEMAGYNSRGIAMALTQYSITGLNEWLWEDEEQDIINRYNSQGKRETIDALKWSGSINGQRLSEFGLSGVKDNEEYQAEIEIVGGFVIRAAISPDPDGSPNYYFSHWSSVPGSFYGDALPELMADTQDICNASARALVENMEMSSGPMVWVDASKLDPADLATAHIIHARKVYRANPDSENQINNAGAAIQFFQPSSNAHELMSIYEKFSAIADEVTGLPKFAVGSDQGAGAARTASGLSMLMNASSKTIKHVVRSIDINLIEPLIKKIYDHEMMYGEDDSIKGDLRVKARGSQSLIHKEQMMLRQQEFLAQTGNPIDMQIMGVEGRAELLKGVAKTTEIPVDRIIPSKEELQRRTEQMAQAEQQELMALEQRAAA